MFRVVVVEDEELLRMGITNFFDWSAYGFELAGEAGNGLKGLELARELKPDLVITDIKMPHMDGIEMTEKLVSEMPDLMVLIISGYDEFQYAKRAMKAGVSEYILKPIKMEDLKEAVGRIRDTLEKRRTQREELLQLKNSHRDNLRVRRAELFAELLLKGMQPEALEGKRDPDAPEEYGLSGIISLRNFSALCMDCDYAVVMEKDRELEEMIDRCLREAFSEGQRDALVSLRTTNGERLLCFCGGERESVKEMRDMLEKYIRGEKELSEQLDLTFGDIGYGLAGLQNSYKKARKRSEEKFAKSWQEAVGKPDADGGKVRFFNYDLEGLLSEIKDGSREGVQREMEELRQSLSAEKVPSYLQVVLVISNIYSELIRIPGEVGGRGEDVVPDPYAWYQSMIGKMKREEMLGELEAFCLKLHEYYQEITRDRKQEMMRRVEDYMREHYMEENLSMKDVAEHVYISVSYLGLIMRKEAGKTFTEFLTDIRIEKAKQMLVRGDMKNYEIAEACGYTTPAYFSTVFKSVTGKTPTEYRNSLS